MEAIFSLLNSIPSPYSDFVAVIVLFLITVLVAFIISFFFEAKPEKKIEEVDTAEPPQPIPQDISAQAGEGIETVQAAPGSLEEKLIETEEKIIETIEKALPHEAGTEAAAIGQEEIPEEGIADVQAAPASETAEEPPQAVEEPPVAHVEPEAEIEETKEGLFAKLRSGLSQTHSGIFGRLGGILSKKEIDESTWDDFEETLIMADLGVGTTMKLRERIESRLAKKSLGDEATIEDALKEEILQILKQAEGTPIKVDRAPFIVIVAGVNGVGKTTTIGKLAYKLKQENKEIMIAAGDTFRAAATEQLEVWSKRVGTEFLKGQSGADPSSIAYDAVKAASARNIDVLIIDTAGRLHTKGNLMEELKKMKRVVGRELEGAPHETLLVLDATTGQNAIQQAKMFDEALDVTGIVLTKLDGTAKGGVIIAIADELNIPVKYIGIGESLNDLREFKAQEFVEALFYSGEETVH